MAEDMLASQEGLTPWS